MVPLNARVLSVNAPAILLIDMLHATRTMCAPSAARRQSILGATEEHYSYLRVGCYQAVVSSGEWILSMGLQNLFRIAPLIIAWILANFRKTSKPWSPLCAVRLLVKQFIGLPVIAVDWSPAWSKRISWTKRGCSMIARAIWMTLYLAPSLIWKERQVPNRTCRYLLSRKLQAKPVVKRAHCSCYESFFWKGIVLFCIFKKEKNPFTPVSSQAFYIWSIRYLTRSQPTLLLTFVDNYHSHSYNIFIIYYELKVYVWNASLQCWMPENLPSPRAVCFA